MDYQKKARALKAAGFVDYDLRKKLNQGQKAAITKIWRDHSAVITHSENFVSRVLAPKAADKMKRDGYTVNKNGKVFIQKEGYKNVTVKSRKTAIGKIDVTITRKTGRKTSKTKVYTDSELFTALEKFNDKKLKKNQFATVRIGDNAAFAHTYKDKNALMNYIKNIFQPKDPKTDKDYLISQMSIVTIDGERPERTGRKGKNGPRGKRK